MSGADDVTGNRNARQMEERIRELERRVRRRTLEVDIRKGPWPQCGRESPKDMDKTRHKPDAARAVAAEGRFAAPYTTSQLKPQPPECRAKRRQDRLGWKTPGEAPDVYPMEAHMNPVAKTGRDRRIYARAVRSARQGGWFAPVDGFGRRRIRQCPSRQIWRCQIACRARDGERLRQAEPRKGSSQGPTQPQPRPGGGVRLHFCNPRRRHSKLGCLGTMPFEARAPQAKSGVHKTGGGAARGRQGRLPGSLHRLRGANPPKRGPPPKPLHRPQSSWRARPGARSWAACFRHSGSLLLPRDGVHCGTQPSPYDAWKRKRTNEKINQRCAGATQLLKARCARGPTA